MVHLYSYYARDIQAFPPSVSKTLSSQKNANMYVGPVIMCGIRLQSLHSRHVASISAVCFYRLELFEPPITGCELKVVFLIPWSLAKVKEYSTLLIIPPWERGDVMNSYFTKASWSIVKGTTTSRIWKWHIHSAFRRDNDETTREHTNFVAQNILFVSRDLSCECISWQELDRVSKGIKVKGNWFGKTENKFYSLAW